MNNEDLINYLNPSFVSHRFSIISERIQEESLLMPKDRLLIVIN